MKITLRHRAVAGLLLTTAFLVAPGYSIAQDATEVARKVLSKARPVYPTLARSMNIHGVVKVEALVAPNGTVKSLNVKGGHPLLTQSAVTAVGHWRFEPAYHETKELIEIQFDPQ